MKILLNLNTYENTVDTPSILGFCLSDINIVEMYMLPGWVGKPTMIQRKYKVFSSRIRAGRGGDLGQWAVGGGWG